MRGEVRLWSFTEDPVAVARYGPLETLDGTRRFEIEELRAAKDHFVARLAGVEGREAAEALRNTDLYVPRERLPPVEEADTWYHADLIGLRALTADGNPLGTVTAVHNFGAGDIIEIAPGGGRPSVLISFTETTVPEVDVKGGQIVVAVPEETEGRESTSAHPRESGTPRR